MLQIDEYQEEDVGLREYVTDRTFWLDQLALECVAGIGD